MKTPRQAKGNAFSVTEPFEASFLCIANVKSASRPYDRLERRRRDSKNPCRSRGRFAIHCATKAPMDLLKLLTQGENEEQGCSKGRGGGRRGGGRGIGRRKRMKRRRRKRRRTRRGRRRRMRRRKRRRRKRSRMNKKRMKRRRSRRRRKRGRMNRERMSTRRRRGRRLRGRTGGK
ncbi:hypothetical protein PoB_004968000 [Plakobranchus ocellatus]|uniref:Uncharacterized protein n=1 Tax=Plakobranchus ocellatus TaxID=259542 RepID=A0AAV4BVN6_9GAST|nr:hypothetical protein PoB_004968000 [Plakobranchus ocellatus]